MHMSNASRLVVLLYRPFSSDDILVGPQPLCNKIFHDI